MIHASSLYCITCSSEYHCAFTHLFFFFFQAEDGIRDLIVTGVQTCALPILFTALQFAAPFVLLNTPPPPATVYKVFGDVGSMTIAVSFPKFSPVLAFDQDAQIGRASCRERV